MKLLSKNLLLSSSFNKKTLIILGLFCFVINTNAQQNFIPNPSFEKIDSCPVYANSIQLAQPWDTLKNGGGAGPDLFAECGAVGLSIPLGFIQGYQYARSGKVFMNSDFYAYPLPNLYPYYHDYMQTPLLDTLQSGKIYCVTFYVNLSNRSKYAIADIGAYFDDGRVSTCWYCPAIVNPQVVSPANVYINDTI
ncbi:MAG: hypothetical protein RL065_990, partial [Bacteroidota bacterium]